MEIIKFSSMEVGYEYDAVLLVKELVDKGFTKKGEPFVSASLYDGKKVVKASIWNNTVDTLAEQGIEPGIIVQVVMTVTPNDNGFYYNIKDGSLRVNNDDSISVGDFIHTAPIDPEKNFAWLIEVIDGVDSDPEGNGPYKSVAYLTRQLLIDNKESFIRSSAAEKMHHNFLYGLLYHTVRMVSSALYLSRVYTIIDKELLVCGTALHDLAKITCYDTDNEGVANFSVQGRLLEHSLVGAMMIHDVSQKDVYNPEKIMLLEHMLASHHGKLEWGAVTTPAIPEAELLHLIDMIDSRMNMFEEAYDDQKPGTLSNDKVYGLENSKIYKAMYPED